MKLMVHNFLTSKFLKGVTTGYPLKLIATKTTVTETAFDAEFVARTLPRIDYGALRMAAQSMSMDEGLPDALPEDVKSDETLLKKLHHLLMEVDVVEGQVVCPETGREFPIKDGIPNMLAREDEIQ